MRLLTERLPLLEEMVLLISCIVIKTVQRCIVGVTVESFANCLLHQLLTLALVLLVLYPVLQFEVQIVGAITKLIVYRLIVHSLQIFV